METITPWTILLLALILFSGFNEPDQKSGINSRQTKSVSWNIWPGEAPGGPVDLPPEIDITEPSDTLIAGKRIIKLHNVSVPTITIYKPDPAVDTRTAVVIAPGGGFWILAMDLDAPDSDPAACRQNSS